MTIIQQDARSDFESSAGAPGRPAVIAIDGTYFRSLIPRDSGESAEINAAASRLVELANRQNPAP